MKLVLFFVALFATLNAQVQFVVVIPSYNNEKWCLKNLESVVEQTYPHFSVIYINDCSTDATSELIHDYVEQRKLQDKVVIIDNQERKGALENIYNAVHSIAPDKVVVLCDGDDWLVNFTVLDALAKVYADKSVWMTYGNYEQYRHINGSCCAPFHPDVAKNLLFRSSQWTASHLRTFYAKLFQAIQREDLLYEGKFYPMAWDLAMMYPMLEMASHGHFRCIRKVLYVYNNDNPLNDSRQNLELQSALDAHIRQKPCYLPLNTL